MNILDTLDTLTKIFHVFGCEGQPPAYHVSPGFALLHAGKGYVCPHCGKPVKDISDTPTGKAYFAFTRPDLGRPQ